VTNLKVVLLHQHLPAGVLPSEIARLHEPSQRLMVCDQDESGPVQVSPERPHCPSQSKKFPLVTGVILLMLVQGSGNTPAEIFVPVVVQLTQYGTYTVIGPVGM
jgi:hypothetical protein